MDRRAAAVAAALATAAAVTALLDGDAAAGLPAVMVADLRSRTAAVTERLRAAVASLQQARVAEEQRIEAERVAAEAAAARAARRRRTKRRRAGAGGRRRGGRRVAGDQAPTTRLAASADERTRAARPASSGGTVSYKNCDAVRAAGAAPLHAGHPGYSSKLDRDGDGIACEKKR